MWRDMNRRCRSGFYLRKGIKVKLTELEFKIWAEQAVANFLAKNPGSTPSVDRVDPDRDYEIGNVRIIDLWKNLARSRYMCRCLGASKYDMAKKNMEKVDYFLNSLLGHLEIPVEVFLNFLKKRHCKSP